MQRVSPDPLFRRRLRTSVLNQYVAVREGHLKAARPRRQMGAIGRSVLYASLALALSVSAAGAAAQDSLPGEPLYGVKLRLEEVRMQIAPASLRDDLAALALEERVGELERLAAAEAWPLVAAAAQRVVAAQEQVAALEPGAPGDASVVSHASQVLEAVLGQAPEAARGGLEHAIQVISTGPADATPPPVGPATGSPGDAAKGNSGNGNSGIGNSGNGSSGSGVPGNASSDNGNTGNSGNVSPGTPGGDVTGDEATDSQAPPLNDAGRDAADDQGSGSQEPGTGSRGQ